MSPDTSLVDRTDRNAALARLLPLRRAVVSAFVVGAVVGLLVAPWLGLVATVIVAAVVVVVVPRTAPAGVISVLGGSESDDTAEPRLFNLVEGLGATSGVEVERVAVVEDPAANLAAVGAGEDAVLVVTRGLLAGLDRIELEAVLAEGLARIRSNDAHLATQAALFVCGPLVRQGPRRRAGGRSVATLFARRRADRLARLLGDQREFLADLAAIDITNYPPGLASALNKMSAVGTGLEGATWGTAHLWLANPLLTPLDGSDQIAVSLNDLFGLHEDMAQRAAFMTEL